MAENLVTKVKSLKAEGNDFFKLEKYNESLNKYFEGVIAVFETNTDNKYDLDTIKSADDISIINKLNLSTDIKALLSVLYSNIAACYLNIKEFKKCIKYCDITLNLDNENIKAFYRKALSLKELQKYSESLQYLKLLLNRDKENKKAKILFLEVSRTIENSSSILNQTKEKLSKLKDTEDIKEIENQLRFIYSHILEDEVYAKDVSKLDGIIDLLMILSKRTKFGLLVIKKLLDINYEVLKKDLEIDTIEKRLTESSDKEVNIILWDIYYTFYTHNDVTTDQLMKVLKISLESMNKYSIKILIKVLNKSKENSKKFVEEFNGFNILLNFLEQKKTESNASINKEKEEELLKEFRNNIQTVAIILGILLPSFGEDNVIKKNGIEITLPLLKDNDIFKQMKGCATLLAILIANLELGVALILETDNKVSDILLDLAKSAPAKTQGLICEIFSYLANNENGRKVLKSDERYKVMLNLLVHSDSINVKTNAAVTLAKLNATKFDKESDQGIIVLSSVAGLLKESSTEEEKAKGIETVSYVITDRDVKIMLCETKEGLKLLDTLVELATREKSVATSAYAYGLAYIFENLTMSEDDKRREKLREMEVTQEQWEQFQKLTKTQTEGHKPDPQENVNKRIKALMDHNGAAALRALVLNGGSERVRESIAKSYCNCAVVQEARGQMFSQGAARALIDLTHEKEKAEIEAKKTKSEEREEKQRVTTTMKQAAHALGKMFITTDPNLIGFSVVLDSLKSLIDNLKVCQDEDLVIFETCMALTNLSTVSRDAKRRIITLGAIKHLEYATYNDDLLVRRSACECLCNLVPEKEMIEWFTTSNHMKLWLMFAGAYEEDLKTSEACLGALAGICSDPEIAKAIEAEEKGLPSLVVLLMSDEPSLIHRVAVCFIYLAEALENGKDKLKAVLVEDAIAKAESLNIGPPVSDLLTALKESLA